MISSVMKSRIPPPTKVDSKFLPPKRKPTPQDENREPNIAMKKGVKRSSSSISSELFAPKRQASSSITSGGSSDVGKSASRRATRPNVSLSVNPSKNPPAQSLSTTPKIKQNSRVVTMSRPIATSTRSTLDNGRKNLLTMTAGSKKMYPGTTRKKYIPHFNVLKEEQPQCKKQEPSIKLNAELLILKTQNEVLVKSNEDFQKKLLEEEAKLKSIVMNHDLSSEKLVKAKTELRTLQNEFEEMRVQHETEATAMENKRLKLQAKVESLIDEKMSLSNTISDLRKDLRTETEKNRNTKEKLEQTETRLMKTTSELSSIKEELTQVTVNLDDSKSELRSNKRNLEKANAFIEQLRCDLENAETQLSNAENKVSLLEKEARAHEKERRMLHNTIQELKGNIRVFARIRPLLRSEIPSTCIRSNDYDYTTANGLTIRIPPNDPEHRKLTLLGPARESFDGCKGDSKTWDFQFDGVFGPERTQEDLFEEISQLVQSVLDGYKVCLFAYGQTGSGKTFTMEGGEETSSRGMIPRAVEQIFETMEAMKKVGWEFDAYATIIEVYNESLRDLLAGSSPSSNLEIRHTRDGHTNVIGVTKHTLKSARQVEGLIRKASNIRATAATLCNEYSSRSHSVFQLHMHARLTVGSEERKGCLTMVDLAGSERVVKSGATGSVFKETKSINKSLTTLGRVITALSNNDAHIPYRESKLTYLLQNSLGGNSKCLMLVNISPAPQHQGETLCSLRFAEMVNRCEIGTARTNSRHEV